MTIPCEECICIAICKHKTYLNLFKDCSTLAEYIPAYDFAGKNRQPKIEQLVEVLKPSLWQFLYDRSHTTDYKIILQPNSAFISEVSNLSYKGINI